MSTNHVHVAHIRAQLPNLHRALIEIVSIMNRPDRDAAMVAAAGLRLDSALFPVLASIERLGPIGVVDLAGRLGRDYTTVSRQVARLEDLELVSRQNNASDKRVREATITAKGKTSTDAIDRARERMAVQAFANWASEDFDQLTRLLGMLADAMGASTTPE
ncbi:MarR family winged helix-turn-helix transcriptional regulator [Sphingobium cupriresistens]|uniref:MarR family transcriptional regulator n=1 Tax=Sphingobium cupriresistens TaxID=1132417 RepID=A0A8G2DWI8_9SPHN|nr:MarR family winged helix-turn-helix transcriptional regulator [Sphingobium cupriresistens]RYM10681.1 MarR family transcriptional regulator [Sphingobium cupriresistens]